MPTRICYSKTELADAMGVSVNTVTKLIDEGALPGPSTHHSVKRDFWLHDDVVDAIRSWRADHGLRPVGDPTCPAL
jgi:hypothetical protein